jgi:hypothetical protein
VSIVTINVLEQQAPLPVTLQQTAAIVSVGATVLTPGTSEFLSQPSSLTPYLKAALALTSLSWSSSVVTATTTTPHGYVTGAVLSLVISGAVPTGYNGTYRVTITGADTFTYALATNPGTETTPGFYQSGYYQRVVAAATTWFAQGNIAGVYVLELGPNSTSTPYAGEIAALATYLTNNPNTAYTAGAQGFFYMYLVPPQWDAQPTYLALVAQYEAPALMTYFVTTTTLSTYANYTAQMKSVLAEIEQPQFAAYPQVGFSAASEVASGGVTTVTGTTTAAHGVPVGAYFQVQGFTPTAYNGWWQAQPGTTGSTLVWNVLGTPGTITVEGTLLANQASTNPIPATEFTAAAMMYDVISNNPSPSNKVPPLDYTFQYGVTSWPTLGMSALLATLQAANISYVGTGSEGGISTATLFGGTTADGNDFLVWYAVDAAQLYSNENLSNAVINGSNNKLNPLYYGQQGISQLQDVVVATMNSLVSWGLGNGQVVQSALSGQDFAAALNNGTYAGQIVVNAIPYLSYLTYNPDDYQAEKYSGLSVQFIASRGFRSIVFNLLVTSFVTQ